MGREARLTTKLLRGLSGCINPGREPHRHIAQNRKSTWFYVKTCLRGLMPPQVPIQEDNLDEKK
jgi:hypothetical protein